MSRKYVVRQQFVNGGLGRILVTEYDPGDRPCGAVVIVPPFAEEMNRCRRMMNLQARALASAGCFVALPDLFGTGDSEGDFGDADWQVWRNDLMTIAADAAGRSDTAPSFLGIRLGALLALDAAADTTVTPGRIVMWSPSLDGDRYLTQFLRLRLASELIASGTSGESTGDLKKRLEAGEAIEVAGYLLTSTMAEAIASASVDVESVARAERIDWLETVADVERGASVASRRETERWRERGLPLHLALAEGPAFWQTAEVAIAPQLIELTTAKLVGE